MYAIPAAGSAVAEIVFGSLRVLSLKPRIKTALTGMLFLIDPLSYFSSPRIVSNPSSLHQENMKLIFLCYIFVSVQIGQVT